MCYNFNKISKIVCIEMKNITRTDSFYKVKEKHTLKLLIRTIDPDFGLGLTKGSVRPKISHF